MPIYAVKATPEGLKALEEYDGENDNSMSFLSAVILARVQETTVTREIYSFLQKEYPVNIAQGGISSAIVKLERLGYVKVFEDVTLDNKVVIEIDSLKIPTTLGAFVKSNLKEYAMPVTKMCEELRWKGVFRLTEANVTIRLS